MKRVITTVGTSIFDNYREEKNDIDTHYQALKEEEHKNWDRYTGRIDVVRKAVINWSKSSHNASAEIKSLLKIQEYFKEDIEAYLIATDSITSRLAAEIIKNWFENYDKIKIKTNFDPKKDVISGLQIADYKNLIKYGLPNLINRINSIAGVGTGSAGYFNDIIFNITGGYKAIIPYMTIMAAVNECKVAYIFEDTDSLILIPPLPIKIDYDIFDKYSYQIAWLDEGIDKYQQAKSQYFEGFTELENKGLVDEIDNGACLSPVGRIFYERFKLRYFIFYAPDDIYKEIEKQEDIKRILKTKFCFKELRKEKTEIKGEHYVYDDGDNNNRIYYLEYNGNIYIYKTFQSEEDARKYINTKVDRDKIIKESKQRRLEVSNV